MQKLEILFGEILPIKNSSPVFDLKSVKDLTESAERLLKDLDSAIKNEYLDDMEFLRAEAEREIPLWMSEQVAIDTIYTLLKQLRQITIQITSGYNSTFDDTVRVQADAYATPQSARSFRKLLNLLKCMLHTICCQCSHAL